MKRSDWFSDVLAIGVLAPLVVAARLQRLALEGPRPSRRGRREAFRMTAEKPRAAAESAVAMQGRLFEAGLKFWADMALAASAFMFAAPVITAAATAPVRRRVRGNARRLTGV